jgi:hypothetical protein
MATQEDASTRSARLSKYFELTVKGKRELKSAADGSRFLGALCDETDSSKRVEAIMAAPKGLDACAKAVRLSLDRSFLIGAGTNFLLYLSAPSLKQLASGHFLYRVLEAVVEPPSFWNALIDAHQKRLLTERASQAFGWLLLEILSSHAEGLPDVRTVAEQVTKDASLINSPAVEVRNFGQKIKHVLNTTSTELSQGINPSINTKTSPSIHNITNAKAFANCMAVRNYLHSQFRSLSDAAQISPNSRPGRPFHCHFGYHLL